MVPETRRLLEPEDAEAPPAPWALARRSDRSPARLLPQAIAHRGYKAAYPENTMAAFRSAVKIGAHAIETDLHLSKDGVVVLSHDGTLKRCFGIDKRIQDCDWAYLSTLRTLREPHEPMPTLAELLDYLAQPGLEEMWVLLDVKLDDDPEELLTRVAETIGLAQQSRPWNKRLLFGCWNATYIQHCLDILPGFPLAHIGFSVVYARQFLAMPNIHFNMFQKVLVGPMGKRLMRDARAAQRAMFVWTVDEVKWMEWSIEKGTDGVITDDPKLFLEVCGKYEDERDEDERAALAEARGEAGAVAAARRRRREEKRSGNGGRGWKDAWLYLDLVGVNMLVIFFATMMLVTGRYERLGPKKEKRRTHV